MKNLILTFTFLLVTTFLFGQQAPCKCTYPLKQNTCWTVGPKGGHYCINKNGSKTYKKKDNSLTTYSAPKVTPKTSKFIK
jgi:hypothetical protein